MCRGFPGGPVVKTAFAAVDLGLIPSDQGTKIPQATWSGTKRRKKKHVQWYLLQKEQKPNSKPIYITVYITQGKIWADKETEVVTFGEESGILWGKCQEGLKFCIF